MGTTNVTIVQRHKKEGSLIWYARVRNVRTGKIRYFSLKTTRKTEAQLLASDMLRAGELDDDGGNANMTFKLGIESYTRYLRNSVLEVLRIQHVPNPRNPTGRLAGIVLREIRRFRPQLLQRLPDHFQVALQILRGHPRDHSPEPRPENPPQEGPSERT